MTEDEIQTTIRIPGRRAGIMWARKEEAKRLIAEGKSVAIWSGGELHKVVGVVDDPNTRLIEDERKDKSTDGQP